MAPDRDHPVDRRFGSGVVDRVTAAASDAVDRHLAADEVVQAGFSAAHLRVFDGERRWSDDAGKAMANAWREAATADLKEGNAELAAWRLAYARLLGDPDESTEEAVAWLRNELERRLRSRMLDVHTAGLSVDLMLVSDDWLPNVSETRELEAAVARDVERRLRDGDDEVMAADRVALWILISQR